MTSETIGEQSSQNTDYEELENLPPFDPNIFITDKNYQAETKMILEEPKYRGASFSQQIIDGRINDTPEKIYASLSDKQKEKFSIEYVAKEAEHERETKMRKFKEYIDDFHGNLKNCRICCTPKMAPFALCNCKKPDGEIAVCPEFTEQVEYLFSSGVEDMTIVASLAHREENGEMTMQVPDVDAYTTMIDKLVSTLRPEDLEKLTIQIGNETNETIDFDDTKITERIEPSEYANFYKQVATKLKEKYPNLKLAVAGVSLMDPEYLKEVVLKIGDDSLIDKIDIHPYRTEIDRPWVPKGNKQIESYSDAEDELLKFAKEHDIELMVGEIQVGGKLTTEERVKKMEEILHNSAKKGIKSNIWPATGLPF